MNSKSIANPDELLPTRRSLIERLRDLDDQANRAVPTHAEVADIVEEDHAARAGFVFRLDEQRANQDVRTARFIDDGRAETIMFALELFTSLVKRAAPELGSTGHNNARRLAARVRIHDVDALHGGEYFARTRAGCLAQSAGASGIGACAFLAFAAWPAAVPIC